MTTPPPGEWTPLVNPGPQPRAPWYPPPLRSVRLLQPRAQKVEPAAKALGTAGPLTRGHGGLQGRVQQKTPLPGPRGQAHSAAQHGAVARQLPRLPAVAAVPPGAEQLPRLPAVPPGSPLAPPRQPQSRPGSAAPAAAPDSRWVTPAPWVHEEVHSWTSGGGPAWGPLADLNPDGLSEYPPPPEPTTVVPMPVRAAIRLKKAVEEARTLSPLDSFADDPEMQEILQSTTLPAATTTVITTTITTTIRPTRLPPFELVNPQLYDNTTPEPPLHPTTFPPPPSTMMPLPGAMPTTSLFPQATNRATLPPLETTTTVETSTLPPTTTTNIVQGMQVRDLVRAVFEPTPAPTSPVPPETVIARALYMGSFLTPMPSVEQR